MYPTRIIYVIDDFTSAWRKNAYKDESKITILGLVTSPSGTESGRGIAVGLPTVPSTGTAVKLAAIFSAFWARDVGSKSHGAAEISRPSRQFGFTRALLLSGR
ncbi:hypothetical protein B0H11DRAFT_1922647 [Mycena galericulata]|nr:hypothetical protein B0H11DRAFT_1922647 [Mycena galericulata]